jgi:hypothetical protein
MNSFAIKSFKKGIPKINNTLNKNIYEPIDIFKKLLILPEEIFQEEQQELQELQELQDEPEKEEQPEIQEELIQEKLQEKIQQEPKKYIKPKFCGCDNMCGENCIGIYGCNHNNCKYGKCGCNRGCVNICYQCRHSGCKYNSKSIKTNTNANVLLNVQFYLQI